MAKNSNAQIGEEPLKSVLHVRILEKDREKWKSAADDAGVSLSRWVTRVLNNRVIEDTTWSKKS